MSDDPHEEGAVCDFCKIAVDPDESLQPIYVGHQPQPKPHYLSEVAERDGSRMLGKPIGIYEALYNALKRCDDIEINESMRVEEVRAVGGETHYASMDQGVRGDVSFDTQTYDDKVGVSLKIHPKDVTYDPDAEVCDTCAEMFKTLRDE